MSRHLTTVALVAALALAAPGCSGDDSTGPDGDGRPEFPTLDPEVLGYFCVRGESTKGDTESGTLNSGDCWSSDFDPEDDSYFETWRGRVASSTTVVLDVSSNFDSWLELYELEGIDGDTPELTMLAWNDDRNGSDLDAMITMTLHPGRDYFVVVSGYDSGETGPYTLALR